MNSGMVENTSAASPVPMRMNSEIEPPKSSWRPRPVAMDPSAAPRIMIDHSGAPLANAMMRRMRARVSMVQPTACSGSGATLPVAR